MSEETPMVYNAEILYAAKLYGQSAAEIYQILGFNENTISSTALLAGPLEEINDSHENVLDTVLQTAGQLASDTFIHTHEGIKEEFEIIDTFSPEEFLTYRRDFDGVLKLTDPIMLDIGPANVQLYTAIKQLQQYNLTYTDTDPLSLKQYNGSFDQLQKDLSNPLSNLAI